MCGLPGTGKSTATMKYRDDPEWFVYSTDDYVDKIAEEKNQTYNSIFGDEIMNQATSAMNSLLINALKEEKNILWDQTNLSIKKRKSVLDKVGDSYYKECWYFPLFSENYKQWKQRLDSRLDKTIPSKVLESMIRKFQEPTINEGFCKVKIFDLYGVLLDIRG